MIASCRTLFSLCTLAVVFVIGCGVNDSSPGVTKSRTITQKKRRAGVNSYQPFSFRIYQPSEGGVTETTTIQTISEATIEEEVHKLDWVNMQQEVVLESRDRKMTVRGFTSATEEWFQLHAVWLEYSNEGNKVLYSGNLSGPNEVVDVLHSCFRKDGKWKTMLAWSDKIRPIPKRLLPRSRR